MGTCLWSCLKRTAFPLAIQLNVCRHSRSPRVKTAGHLGAPVVGLVVDCFPSLYQQIRLPLWAVLIPFSVIDMALIWGLSPPRSLCSLTMVWTMLNSKRWLQRAPSAEIVLLSCCFAGGF